MQLMPIFNQEIALCMDRWRCMSTQGPVSIFHDATQLTVDMISVAVFDYRFNSNADVDADGLRLDPTDADYELQRADMFALMHEMGHIAEPNIWLVMKGWEYMPWVPNRRHGRSVCAKLDKVAYAAIARKRRQRAAVSYDAGSVSHDAGSVSEVLQRTNSGSTILDLLLDVRTEDGQTLSDLQLRDHVITFLFAGHETTSTTMSWTLLLLAQHPDKLRRAQAELDAVYGPYTGENILPTSETLQQCKYTFSCVKEALRMKPPVNAWSRTAQKDVEIAGKALPKGTVVCISPILLHYDTDYWEYPDSFVPERWDNEHELLKNPAQFMPFSRGPRNCIGMVMCSMCMCYWNRNWQNWSCS
eukprot:TRINITY_DN1585_c0_g1_i2.p1 TRINITY_DN1585_c0_g1~~TRINITY_DN1585_c0_g1_i2.p1  ORF type:complete len:358 (-),score=71.54 TRINITY_DN1585_c0_g1_i2:254-1327(-)